MFSRLLLTLGTNRLFLKETIFSYSKLIKNGEGMLNCLKVLVIGFASSVGKNGNSNVIVSSAA